MAGLTQMRTLSLCRTRVTAAGLKELAGLKQLQTLDRSETQVTASGPNELAVRKPSQTQQYLFETQMIDEALKELQKGLALFTNIATIGAQTARQSHTFRETRQTNHPNDTAGRMSTPMGLMGHRICP